jgi:hypothetical protein
MRAQQVKAKPIKATAMQTHTADKFIGGHSRI